MKGKDDTILSLNTHLKSLRIELERCKTSLDQGSLDYEAKNEEIKILKEELNESTKRNSALEKEIGGERKRMLSQEVILDETSTRCEQMQSELDVLMGIVPSLEAQVEELGQEIQNNERIIASQAGDIEDLKALVNDQKTSHSALLEDIGVREQEIKDLKEERERHARNLLSKEEEMSDLKKWQQEELIELNRKLEDNSHRHMTLNENHVKLQDEHKALQEAHKSKEEDINRVTRKAKELLSTQHEKFLAVQAQLADSERARYDLETRLGVRKNDSVIIDSALCIHRLK